MSRRGITQPINAHINYQGRLGIYFNVLFLSGTVTLSGTGVSGAIVRLIKQSTDSEVAKTTTNASGFYSFAGNPIVAGENYHIAVEYTDGGTNKYNAKSLWNVTPVVV